MTVDIKGMTEADQLLMRLPVEMRTKAVPSALRAHARPTANRVKQLTPRGDLNHEPSKPPLYTTIKVVIRHYGETVLAVVGASWPGGAHFRLVDKGHKKVLWGRKTGAKVPGKEILAPAIDQTEAAGRKNMIKKLKEHIVKAGG